MKLSFSFNTQRGNLDSRSNNAFSTTWSESFSYDNLDRLTNFNDNNGNKSQSYDGQGRITASSRLGTYTYDNSSPYRQIGLSNLSSYALYHYQNRPLQQVTYNAFKSPVEIYEQGRERISYQYNASESRAHAYYGSDNADKMARPMRRHYSEDGSMEITEDLANSKTSFIFYLGGDAYSAPAIYKEEHTSGTTGNLYYLHRDHLGSINLITDASGNVVEKRQFDAWGSIVKLEDGSGNALSEFLIIDRGYTGHEHLLGVGLINMNARLYDPVLHRFLSPDNYVQDPSNSQNFNRYGYVMNNPLKYTDESGEFWQIFVGAAISVVTNGFANLANGQKFFHGAGKAALMGAVGGAASWGIGSAAGQITNTVARTAFQTAAHGVLGGTMSAINGQSFGSGFLAGGFGSLAGAGAQNLLGGASVGWQAVGTTLAGGAIGGITSEMSGGSFWDGARDGLISAGLNHAAHELTQGDPYKKALKQYLQDLGDGTALLGSGVGSAEAFIKSHAGAAIYYANIEGKMRWFATSKVLGAAKSAGNLFLVGGVAIDLAGLATGTQSPGKTLANLAVTGVAVVVGGVPGLLIGGVYWGLDKVGAFNNYSNMRPNTIGIAVQDAIRVSNPYIKRK